MAQLVLFLVLIATARADEPLFRADAEYVVVDVQVLSQGRPVTGLKRANFRIEDNGQTQQIAHFSVDRQELDIILLLDVSASTSLVQIGLQPRGCSG